jgi:hypothetical protein
MYAYGSAGKQRYADVILLYPASEVAQRTFNLALLCTAILSTSRPAVKERGGEGYRIGLKSAYGDFEG